MRREFAPTLVSLQSDPESSANRRGILFMVLAMGTFIGNDVLVKIASDSVPTAQLIFIRGVFACLWVLMVARAMGVSLSLSTMTGGWIGTRALVDAASTFAYLISLFHMPLGNAIAINMAAPLMLTLMSVVLLRESVDWRRWLAVVAGFAGVLLIIRPATDGFNAYSLLCLFGTLLHCIRDMMTRQIPGHVSSVLVTFSSAFAVTVVAGAGTAWTGWQATTPAALATVAVASVFLAAGYLFIILSTRTGSLAVVAPFRYSGLPMALLLGWLIWSDVPDLASWIGIGLICGTGLYLLGRARGPRASVHSRRPADASQS